MKSYLMFYHHPYHFNQRVQYGENKCTSRYHNHIKDTDGVCRGALENGRRHEAAPSVMHSIIIWLQLILYDQTELHNGHLSAAP